ncbi:Uncharacterised protein [Mycobacteroides abscessus subsp. abscessus]|nr:Uncharacterised protein [Mycobacteroides abscessus subsp. abscessus]
MTALGPIPGGKAPTANTSTKYDASGAAAREIDCR